MARPARKKAAIERAALELFAEVGIDAASIRMIAERAEVTEGALYRHHRGKDDLVLHLFHQYFESMGAMLREAAQGGGTLDERLRAMVRGFYTAYDADPKAFQFVLLVQHRILESVRAREELNPVDVLQGVVREAIKSGEAQGGPGDERLLAQLLLGAVMQAAVGARYGRIKGPLADRADAVAARCAALLRGGAPPPQSM